MSGIIDDEAECLEYIEHDLDRQWQGFGDQVIAPGATAGQRAEMRLAFVSGWYAALQRLAHIAEDPDPEADAEDVATAAKYLHLAAVRAMQAELAALEARASQP